MLCRVVSVLHGCRGSGHERTQRPGSTPKCQRAFRIWSVSRTVRLTLYYSAQGGHRPPVPPVSLLLFNPPLPATTLLCPRQKTTKPQRDWPDPDVHPPTSASPRGDRSLYIYRVSLVTIASNLNFPRTTDPIYTPKVVHRDTPRHRVPRWGTSLSLGTGI